MDLKMKKHVSPLVRPKKGQKAESEVCADNIFRLSNIDVKTVLRKFSSLPIQEKDKVKQFHDDLKINNINRYKNLLKFFKEAFNSEKNDEINNQIILNNSKTNETKNVNDVIFITQKLKQEHSNETSTNEASGSTLEKEKSSLSFHTNITSNQYIVDGNQFNKTLIHQNVLNQCISSLLPQVFVNNPFAVELSSKSNAVSIATALLENNKRNSSYQRFNQNKNKLQPPHSVEINQNTTICNLPSVDEKMLNAECAINSVFKKSDKKCVANDLNVKHENMHILDKQNSNSVKSTETIHVENSDKSSVSESNNNKIACNVDKNIQQEIHKKIDFSSETKELISEKNIENVFDLEEIALQENKFEGNITILNSKEKKAEISFANAKNYEKVTIESKTVDNFSNENNQKSLFAQISKSIANDSKKVSQPVIVQDLESFSMEYIKKIETFAKQNLLKNSIKLNLSTSSQIKITEACNKINQPVETETLILRDIKPFYDKSEINMSNESENVALNVNSIKETTNVNSNVIKTSYDESEKSLNATDHLIDDEKTVKSKITKHVEYTTEKNYPKYIRTNKPNSSPGSDFLAECNRLKLILTKSSNVDKPPAEDYSRKSSKNDETVTKRKPKKKKRRRNKSNESEHESPKHIKLTDIKTTSNEMQISVDKNQTDRQKIKTNSIKKDRTIESILNIEALSKNKKKGKKREVKIVNRVLRNDNANDQIIKVISEKPFTEECNKVTMLENKNTNSSSPFTKSVVNYQIDKTIDTADLMVLLKYFYKLEGQEQHRLIDFLKELELSEPERVADLRKHVRTSPPVDDNNDGVKSFINCSHPEAENIIDNHSFESVVRPESRNSNLSNIDLILEDIDDILQDEDKEQINDLSDNNDDCWNSSSKQLKNDVGVKSEVKYEIANSSSSSGKTIPVQFKNCKNITFSSEELSQIHCKNYDGQNVVNCTSQYQSYDPKRNQNSRNSESFIQNVYSYEANTIPLLMQNQNTGFQNQQNVTNIQNYQNFFFNNYTNQFPNYQQNYSYYQNNGYFK